MRQIISLTIIIGLCWKSAGRADIYRLDGAEGVISFSDAPNDRRYQLIMKEQPARNIKRSRQSQAVGPYRADVENAKTLPIQGIITSGAGLRTDPFDGKLKHHNGLDIAAPSGTPVKPVAPGTVIFSGWKGGYGNMVILDHHDGMVTVYAHHSSNSVNEGDTVDLNTIIALSGSTGRSTGPHLHFEAWLDGINITADYMPGTVSGRHAATVVKAPIRRILQGDGTILFTNLR